MQNVATALTKLTKTLNMLDIISGSNLLLPQVDIGDVSEYDKFKLPTIDF
jgi:hypothetical protein